MTWAALEPLWVGGLAVWCLLVGHLVLTGPWLDAPAKTYDWAQYMNVGILFPSLVLGWCLLPRVAGARWARAVQRVLVLVCLLAGGLFIAREGEPTVLLVAGAQLVVMREVLRGPDGKIRPALVGVGFAVTAIAWTLAIRMLFWLPFPEAVTLGLPSSLVVFAVLLLLVCAYVGADVRADEVRHVRLLSPANGVAILLIGLVAFRTDGLFDVSGELGAVHHWGVFVGPAELVRQGAWLYWDAPSPYGFLSILALAAFPFGTPWEALYVLHAAFLFVASVFLFLTLRSSRPGLVNWFGSLVITLAALFFIPAAQFLATHIYPSSGPYRFFWCYALLAVLIWEVRTLERSRAQRRVLIVGCMVWLLGVLWSPESAVYASVVWLPAYVFVVARRTLARGATWRGPRFDLHRAAAWLALPPLLLLVTLGTVVAYYVVRLGHAPDPIAYVDYLLTFSQGFAGLDMDPQGAILTFLLGFSALVMSAAYALRDGLPVRWLGLVVGLWGALWAPSSYFVGRADTYNLVRAFLPFACLAMGLLLWYLARRPGAGAWRMVSRLSVVPVLMVVLMLVGIDRLAVTAFAQRYELRDVTNIERRLPTIDPSLADLFATAGVRPDDPIVYGGSNLGNLLPVWDAGERRVVFTRAWLPTFPLALFAAIRGERKPVYLSRFVERARLGGWLVQRKEEGSIAVSPEADAYSPQSWFFDQLRATHAATKGFQNDGWSVVWFEYVGREAGGGATGDRVSPGLYRPGPRDILVDGRPQIAGEGLWASHGTGWYPAASPTGDRWATSPARLDVYSAEARVVDLRTTPLFAKPDPATGLSTLRVAANGGTPQAVAVRAGEPLRVAIDLRPGWNSVVLELAEGNFVGKDYDPKNTDPRPFSFQLTTIDIVTQ